MRARIFLVPLAILGYLLSAATSVSAQYDSAIDDVFQDIATDVAKVLIIDTTPVEIDGVSYTMAEAQVVATYKGAVSGTILLQVEGGLRADGHQVVVSDQPFLSAHDELEVALVRSPTQNARHAVPGVDGVVYSIVGGLGGVSPVTGELVSQADAVGDFGLTGARFAEFPSDFYVNPANSGVDANATVNAVRSALQTWEDDLGSDIDFTYQGTTAATGSLSDEKNTIYWTATPNPATTYLAQASWITTQTGDIIGFDVVFNRDYAWSAGAASGRFDIATVMLHESGHALGLAHVPASSEIMYFQIQSGAAKGLGAGDRAGVAFLYPAASQDPAQVDAPQQIIDGFEAYAEINGTYRATGGGKKGNGTGWFSFADGTTYPDSIANVLNNAGVFANGIPTEPSGGDFFIRRCADRVGVFANAGTDIATSQTNMNWWIQPRLQPLQQLPTPRPLPTTSARRLPRSPPSNPRTNPAQVDAPQQIIDGFEAYAEINGTYRATGGGKKGNGTGWFSFADGTTYPDSIANVLNNAGVFANGIPTEPSGGDFFIRRCADRVGVFANAGTDIATSQTNMNWWTNQGCNPFSNYQHLALSQPLAQGPTQVEPPTSEPTPTPIPAQVDAPQQIIDGFEAYAEINGTYRATGGGKKGNGTGWFSFADGTTYPDSIANVLNNAGVFANGIPTEPSGGDFFIRRCADRVGVFANAGTDIATSQTNMNWWTNQGCNPFSNYQHLALSQPLS